MKAKAILLCITITAILLGSCSSENHKVGSITAQEILSMTKATEWDLVILGDSDMWLSYEYYSKYFEEDLGIDIVIHDETKPTTLTPVAQLNDDLELQLLISEAEIVVFNIPFVHPDVGGGCFDYDKEIEEDKCFEISQTEYTETTRNMIRAIKELVGEKGAMIRLQNMFVPTRYWQDNIRLEDRTTYCLECFAAYWQAQALVADEEGIPLVDVFTQFHGENRDQDPYENGFIGPDRIHVNEYGAEAIAKIYREIGYEYWKP